ncbi:MAG TPA: PAS domain-containing protein [Stellaceae bacterium]|nr:PAS domain-containing protein [Stellaceae bacterium]
MGYDYRGDAVHGSVLRYWEMKRGARCMPARRDIDPTDLPRVLPYLQLIEVVAPDRFRYRLVGTAIVQTFGHDYTGRFLDELTLGADRINFFARRLRAVRDNARPLFVRTQYVSAKGVHFMANRLYVPLSENDRDVNVVLGSLTFEFSRGTTRDGVLGSAQLDASQSEVEIVDPVS